MKVKGKLVRDRIPEIMKQRGAAPVVRRLAPLQFKRALREKLLEEAKEVSVARGPQLLEELADVHEVLSALEKAYDISKGSIESIRRKKLKERGGFEDRLFLH